MINNSRKHLLKLGGSLMLVFFLFFAMGESKMPLSFELKKAVIRNEEPVRVSRKAVSVPSGEPVVNFSGMTEKKPLF
jgi:hypothetical protein